MKGWIIVYRNDKTLRSLAAQTRRTVFINAIPTQMTSYCVAVWNIGSSKEIRNLAIINLFLIELQWLVQCYTITLAIFQRNTDQTTHCRLAEWIFPFKQILELSRPLFLALKTTCDPSHRNTQASTSFNAIVTSTAHYSQALRILSLPT